MWLILIAGAGAWLILKPGPKSAGQGGENRVTSLPGAGTFGSLYGVHGKALPGSTSSSSGGGLVGGADSLFDIDGVVACKEFLAGGKMSPECEQALIDRGKAVVQYGEKAVEYVGSKIEGGYSTVKGWFS